MPRSRRARQLEAGTQYSEGGGGCRTQCALGAGSCVVACAGQKPAVASRVLRLSSDAVAKIRGYMQKTTEVGGTIEPTADMRELVVREGRGGGKDSVVIPVGTFQFHTHPNKCESRANCYFEFPSEHDMSLIAQDCMRGAVAHFVFTHGFVYKVSLSGDKRLELGAMKRDGTLQKEVDRIFDVFHKLLDRLQDQARSRGIGPEIMAQFRGVWAEAARQEGFEVEMIPSAADIAEYVEIVDPRKSAAQRRT